MTVERDQIIIRQRTAEIASLADVAREDCRDPWTVMQQMRARLLRLPPCPHCHAPAGEPCRSHFGGEALRQIHRAREVGARPLDTADTEEGR